MVSDLVHVGLPDATAATRYEGGWPRRYRRDDVPAGALVSLPVSAGTVEGRARVVLDMTPLLTWMEQNLSRDLPLPAIARQAAIDRKSVV